ncbi:MAG: peptidylprolyl isomerase [Afipia sp.]|nr:peptidylprolyl isomerase [Afipia sp.]
MIRILAVLAAFAFVSPALAQQKLPANLDKDNAIVIDTTKGRVIVKLNTDIAPKHAERIKQLARDGYYDNVPFHRVIEGFMAQTGDGKNFDGTGGSKYPNLAAEFTATPFKRGTVGMARSSSPDSANSQFFICFGDAAFLNNKYTVVGEVVSGMDVVDRMKRGEPVANPDKMTKVQVASDIK